MSTLKEFAGEIINMTEKLKIVLERIKNIVGKGEITSIFSVSLNVFKKLLLKGC